MSEENAVETLSRWIDSGAMWRVLHRAPTSITVSMCRYDGGEEMERLTSTDPKLLTWIGDRQESNHWCAHSRTAAGTRRRLSRASWPGHPGNRSPPVSVSRTT